MLEAFSWAAVAAALTLIVSASFLAAGYRGAPVYASCLGSLSALLGLYIIIHYGDEDEVRGNRD